jgi:NitT/TauT family transport system ATP-binding protein
MLEFQDTELPNIIEMSGISQSYDGGKNFIIQDLSFLVQDKPDRGEFISILGMSGSGKSTLLRYIAGLQEPTTGEVLVRGKAVGGDNRVSMVFQQYSSLPWKTVLENVALGLEFKGISKEEREERAMEMIRKVGLAGHEKKYAQYPTLSGGQLQRIAIARSLLASPDIILMDEPFGALDIKTRLQMQDMLADIWQEIHPTVIFVTHDISEAVYLGDEVYILKSAPSHFVEKIDVDLPFNRNRELKRTPKFTEIVHYVEDKMIEVAGMG